MTTRDRDQSSDDEPGDGPDDHDPTPLPPPMAFHVADPTSQGERLDVEALDELPELEGEPTRPGHDAPPGSTGLAEPVRPSGLSLDEELDLAAEMETRQRPRIDAAELQKISQPPPTGPVDRVDDEITLDRDDATTPIARGSDEDLTLPRKRPLTGRDD